MKRLPIIVLTLALCLLTAACGAKPNEPDDGDSAKAGIVERMATVTAEEIKYVPSFVADVSLNAEEVASKLRSIGANSLIRACTIIRWKYTSPADLTHTVHLTNTSFSLPDWMKTI